VGGIDVKTVAVVNLFDKVLNQLVIKCQRATATRALQVMVV
jgi:hypothetical protein